MNKVFTDIYETVWQDVFPEITILEIEKFKKFFASDFILPEKHKSAMSGQDVWSSPEYNSQRVVSFEDLQQKETDLVPKVEISSLKEILNKIKDVAYFRGSRSINSEIVEESDDIYSSSYVYNSLHLFNCQKMVYCHHCVASEFLLASKNSKESTFGIRIMDSQGISSSFDIYWSAKCSRSYFCSNSVDLRDCIFCFNLSSKQFCIGNMQFEESEYKAIKEKLLREYFEQLNKPTAFRTLANL